MPQRSVKQKLAELKLASGEDLVKERREINTSRKLELESNLKLIKNQELEAKHANVVSLKNTISSAVSLSKMQLEQEKLDKCLSKHPPTANLLPFTSSKVYYFLHVTVSSHD